MENENLKIVTPSYVGPLAAAEDSADKFISGIIYCNLLEKLAEQQLEVNDVLNARGEVEAADLKTARESAAALEEI